jgi:ADP-heptose:LPS heptosyltransferase
VPKFLIIRFSSIGDIVLTTPVIRCLKSQVDGAEVHYITKKQYSSVLEANPYIDKIWLYDKDLKEILIKLQAENFDYVIDLHNNLRSLKVKAKLRKPSYSFNKINFRKWLVVNLKINILPDIHIVDRYISTLKAFGVVNDKKGLDYFLPSENKEKPHSFMDELPSKYVALVIGAQHETKKATAETLSAICDKIQFPVVIVGGKEDIPLAESILKKALYPERIRNTAGKLSLNQSAYLVKNAEVVISHDTGLMHIAAAYRRKIISIWGNTIPEFGMYPYLPDSESKIFEVKGLKCRPCSKIGYQACPKGHFKCIKEQNTEQISNWANKIFQS